MLWVFTGLLGSIAFVFLTRLFWSDAANRPKDNPQDTSQRPPRQQIVTLAIVILLIALIMMIATGRLHWLSAAITGAIPFLRRGVSLLRFAPLLKRLLPGVFGQSAGSKTQQGSRRAPQTPTLTKNQARAMLEVPPDATRDEIIQAHRKLMAKNHPDRGGSNYIAAQLNEAKDLLLADKN